MKDKLIKILVCYHKKAPLYKNDILVPIHCGRDIAFENSKNGKISQEEFDWLLNNTIGDNTGDNISKLNRTLNEMTAIYWAWKNYDKLGNPDYIGLNHYRRYFAINYGELDKILSNFDFIKHKHSKGKYSYYDIWLREGRSKEYIDNAIDLCCKVDPIMGNNICKFLKSNINRGFCNMFVLSKQDFFNYCEYIFPIILKLPLNNIYGRMPGFFAELLTSYYLYTLAKSKKAYNKSIVCYFEDNKFKYIKDKIFSLNTEHLSDKHIIIRLLGLKLKIKAKRRHK